MHRTRGITLIEAVIALFLAATLIALAVPTFARSLQRARIGQVQMAMSESFMTSARTAVGGGCATVLCPLAGEGCADNADWSRGWMVYADVDGDRSYSRADVLVQRTPPLRGLRLRSTDGRRRVVFQTDGGNEGSNLTFTVCAEGGGEAGSLVLSNAGRFRLAPPSPDQRRSCEDA
ncbi:GspH/FimT family pseudopilin [Lysobacter silvisoli]|nr:GspH/FimT family pseudopilin [Lysobacter silvisoli]